MSTDRSLYWSSIYVSFPVRMCMRTYTYELTSIDVPMDVCRSPRCVLELCLGILRMHFLSVLNATLQCSTSFYVLVFLSFFSSFALLSLSVSFFRFLFFVTVLLIQYSRWCRFSKVSNQSIELALFLSLSYRRHPCLLCLSPPFLSFLLPRPWRRKRRVTFALSIST